MNGIEVPLNKLIPVVTYFITANMYKLSFPRQPLFIFSFMKWIRQNKNAACHDTDKPQSHLS